MLKTNKCPHGGFTLIELLVVVLIIGILAAIALPQYKKAVAKSKYATLKNITNSLYQSEQIYYLANNVYATTFDKLDTSFIDSNSAHIVINSSTDCMIEETYLYCRNFRIDLSYVIDFNGNRYCIAYNSNKIAQEVCKDETNNKPPAIEGYSWPY